MRPKLLFINTINRIELFFYRSLINIYGGGGISHNRGFIDFTSTKSNRRDKK